MTNTSEGSKKSSKKQSATTPVSAAQLYRDRLQKIKQTGPGGLPGSGGGAGMNHRPRGTSPGGSARKNRKGHRPG